MATRIPPLTDMQVKRAKPKEKAYKLFDGGGLFLWVSSTGAKSWRLKYRSPETGKEKTITLGLYPDFSLGQAREWRQAMRSLIKRGIDPALQRKEQERQAEEERRRLGMTFDAVAEEFFDHKTRISEGHKARQRRRLEMYVSPWVGAKPIDTIERKDIVECIKRIEERGTLETAHRVFGLCVEIFSYAAAHELIPYNILRDIDKANLFKKPDERNYPTITDPEEIGHLLRDIWAYNANLITRMALRLAIYTASRPGNIRLAEWSEIDLEAKEWIIPAEKMKMKRKHIVPLSRQALAVIEEIRPLTGNSPYLFPSPAYRSRPMSNTTLNMALKRMGYKDRIVAHGFRAMFSTIAHERLKEHGYHPIVIEKALAHEERNAVKAAYNHAEYLEERRGLLQWWADWLDERRGTK